MATTLEAMVAAAKAVLLRQLSSGEAGLEATDAP